MEYIVLDLLGVRSNLVKCVLYTDIEWNSAFVGVIISFLLR